MEIELKIGTKLIVNGAECEVIEGNKCSTCEVQKATSYITLRDGSSKKCGTRKNGNTSWFACSKESRSDKKDILFRRLI